ncbi:glycosyltransferase family 2 protein [Klenkia sp. PcliD-1-E]|uniref:glycosyltransferase family 2 protein n=1 Tax=Klenkia sp. PcliD-1-E TaxID=2954492 RepID=UPI002096EE00|nr:glycosyltransferase family 2 protein [Klenkia sp. PcliD-1-E]MCO7221003.1 EAL domain-containing protein [Klenkia sp. PcliD-1-E]
MPAPIRVDGVPDGLLPGGVVVQHGRAGPPWPRREGFGVVVDRTSGSERPRAPRRQWGSDRRRIPLADPRISDGRLTSGRFAVVLAVAAWAVYVLYTVEQQFIEGRADTARRVIEAVGYLLLVTLLAVSAVAYLITRIGFFYRVRNHQRATRIALDSFIDQDRPPTMTVLVPSYQEEAEVIRTTLLSAALQEYPGLSVVLLVDDPQNPSTARARALLADARALPGQLQDLLDRPASAARAALARFERSVVGGGDAGGQQLAELAADHRDAVAWLDDLAAGHPVRDHTDEFFTQHVLGALARDLATTAVALDEAAAEGARLPTARVRQLHQRLVSIFSVRFSSFERKRYRSLSHEPNKAMNLNSYIGLMGGEYVETTTPLGRMLQPVLPGQGDLVVPGVDFVLTLDADSMLLPEYALRMVHLLSQAENARVAVAQTPYSAFPGAGTRLERISGASTDIQFIVHQGMTQYGATFWVGANAVLRREALEDIVAVDFAGDVEIRRYIQDRTVIEDTESSIDLGIHGWRLHNYPERLAYSATPPDFGSLCIQRQRWANGGLLILSKLRRQVRARRARGEQNRFGELFLRTNYMASIAWSSISLVVMLVYPFDATLLNPLLYLVSVPYFAAMASDLRALGYRRLDALRIYGFNLVLLAVNLAGTAASVLQMVTGEKSAFKRTPKVRNRTTSAPSFLLAPLVLIAFCTWTVLVDVQEGNWVNLFFAAVNASLATYALLAYIGPVHLVVDLALQLRNWVYRPVAVERPRRRRSWRRRGAPAAPGGRVATWPDILGHPVPARPEDHRARHRAGSHVASARSGQDLGLHTFHDHVFFTVFQPVVDTASGRVVGHEALCRFADGLPVDQQLTTARRQGSDTELDCAMASAALASAVDLPAGSTVFLNVASRTWRDPEPLLAVLAGRSAAGSGRLVLDAGQDDLAAATAVARRSGADVALGVSTTAGVGIDLELHRPRWLKLERAIVLQLLNGWLDPAEVVAVVEAAAAVGCDTLACGVEDAEELRVLEQCGVRYVQGFHTGAPRPPRIGTAALVR